MGESTGSPGQGAAPSPPRLTVGGLVSSGRYQLLEIHGGMAGLAFWRARDKRLGRDVALTFVDPLPGEQPPGSATEVLDRTVALTGVYSDGLARVLDVIRGRAGGIVVTEWIPGRSLAAAVADPDPGSAVAAVRGLADAAARAEEAGLVLGLDSPDRIRLTRDGRAVLAFPGVSGSADTGSDIRGLGAVLYSLLTGTWPLALPEGSAAREPRDGRPAAAPVDDDGEVLDPGAVRPDVAPECAVLAMRSLDGSAVSSAATVRAMLADRTDWPAGPDGTLLSDPDSTGDDGADDDTADQPDPATLRRRWQIMAGSGVAAVVVIAFLGAWILGLMSGGQNDAPLAQQLDAIERAAQASRSSETPPPPAEETGPAPSETPRPAPTTPVGVTAVTAWQPAASPGTAENSASAPYVVDGDRSTAWSTDTYLNQLGDGAAAFKPGIGLVFTLDGSQTTRRVVVNSADEGVRFEVRSAPSASPTSLDETTLLGEGTVRDSSGTVTIEEPRESGHLLVWFTRLGTSGPQSYSATVTEVELTR